jgi:hypothetical protein
MVNKKIKVKKLSVEVLQKFAIKYYVTKSGSRKQLALRLLKHCSHIMTLKDLKIIEDFLKLPQSKRYNGPRYGVRKNGTLYCRSGACENEDLN